jgi:hypothetical protein
MSHFTKQGGLGLVQTLQAIGILPCRDEHVAKSCEGDDATARQDGIEFDLDQVCCMPQGKRADGFEKQDRKHRAQAYANRVQACGSHFLRLAQEVPFMVPRLLQAYKMRNLERGAQQSVQTTEMQRSWLPEASAVGK